LNLLDREIINDDSRFTSEAAQMKDELEKKKNSLISAEKQADDFLKVLLTSCFVNT
jgi:kinetochore protein NDC80